MTMTIRAAKRLAERMEGDGHTGIFILRHGSERAYSVMLTGVGSFASERDYTVWQFWRESRWKREKNNANGGLKP